MEWNGDTIRLLRLHLDESQAAFAQRVGSDRYQTVHEWETGKRNPSGSARMLLDRIAQDCGFTEVVARKIARREARSSE